MSETSTRPVALNVYPSDFALLRTPLKPIDFMPAYVPGDRNIAQCLRSRLSQLTECIRDPAVLGAIAHASASLGSRAHKLDPVDIGKENLKLAIALYKYVLRLSRRGTPFGLMAAVTTIGTGDTTLLQPEPEICLHARLDNAYTARIAQAVRKTLLRTRNRHFRLHTNNTANLLSSELRYVARVGPDGDRYRLSSVRRTREIDLILEEAGNHILSGHLITRICERLACNEDDAWMFVEGLISHEILHTEAEISLTSGDCFDALGRTTAAIEGLSEEAALIDMLSKQVRAMNRTEDITEERLREVVEGVSRLLEENPENIINPVHLDAYRRPGRSMLGRSRLRELADDVASLLGVLWRPHEPLQSFARAFGKRFGDAEVPLLEALDADTGICFGPPRTLSNPLLAGAIDSSASTEIELEWDAWRQFLLERILQAASRNEEEVALQREDLAKYARPLGRKNIFLSLAAHVTLLDATEANNAPSMLLRGLYGPSAANLLGRFTCGDPELTTRVRELVDHEQALSPGRLAEVLHLPAGKAANVLARMPLRDTEIVYGPVRPAGSQVLSCGDLLVSLHEGRLRLRDRISGEEIFPRLASAHFTGAYNLPVYQFLAAMQHVDGHVGPVLDSKLFERLPHVPRIRLGSLIISPARWRLDADESKRLSHKSAMEEQMREVRKLRSQRNLPRWVALAQGDNLLDIDLEDPLAVLTLVSEMKGRPAVLLESVSALDQSGAAISDRASANELIVPVHAAIGEPIRDRLDSSHRTVAIAAIRASKEKPLQQWIYLEIFTGESSAERILTDVIGARMRALQIEGRLTRWFYVRYYDGDDFHLRLRLLPSEESDRLNLVDEAVGMFDSCIADGIVSQVRICGYEPELERYGGPDSMPLCEEIFHLHSDAAVRVLGKILGLPDQEDKRWVACAALAWETLATVYQDMAQLADFTASMVQAYRREMPGSSRTAKAISSNYRTHRAALESALEGDSNDPSLGPVRDSCLRIRRRAALKDLTSRHEMTRMARILASLVHMDCNRLFPFSPRANEMMIYEYLGRYARSRHARAQEACAVTAVT